MVPLLLAVECSWGGEALESRLSNALPTGKLAGAVVRLPTRATKSHKARGLAFGHVWLPGEPENGDESQDALANYLSIILTLSIIL